MVFGSDASGWPTCDPTPDPVKVVRALDDENEVPVNSWTISTWGEKKACLRNFSGKFKDSYQIGRFKMPFSINVEEIEQP